jgi:hypothetical protein
MDVRGLPPGARGLRLGETPRISVVVASRGERAQLDTCLAALLPQCIRLEAEVIVSRSGALGTLEGAYPGVSFVDAPAGASWPTLRAAGMAVAEGDVVALTEDHCVPGRDWLEEIVSAQRSGADVAGGAMENGRRERAIDWAAYFAEYGVYLSATPASEPPHITAANVAYGRSVVEDVIAAAREGHWENVAHDRLAARGRTVAFLRTAAVYENQSHRFADFCRDRYGHGRDYACARLGEEGVRRRWLYLLGTPLLPFVLARRIASAAGPERRRPFLRALPFTLLFLGAWAAGEAVGYARGPSPNRPADAGR